MITGIICANGDTFVVGTKNHAGFSQLRDYDSAGWGEVRAISVTTTSVRMQARVLIVPYDEAKAARRRGEPYVQSSSTDAFCMVPYTVTRYDVIGVVEPTGE